MAVELSDRRQAVLDGIADKALASEAAQGDRRRQAEAAEQAEAQRRRGVAEELAAAVEERHRVAAEFETGIRNAMAALCQMIDINASLSKLAMSVGVVPIGLLKASLLRRVTLWLSPQLGEVSGSQADFGAMRIYAGRRAKVSDCFADSESAATNTSINEFIRRELP